MTAPRVFKLMRDTDVSGVSGAGHVADGVVFGDGTTVLRWRSEHRSTAVYASLEDAVAIHGHNGATRFEFEDDLDYDPKSMKVARKLSLVQEEPAERRRNEEELWAAIDAIRDDPSWEHAISLPPGTLNLLKTIDFRNAVISVVADELRRQFSTAKTKI